MNFFIISGVLAVLDNIYEDITSVREVNPLTKGAKLPSIQKVLAIKLFHMSQGKSTLE